MTADTATISLRLASPEDAPAMAALHAASFPEAWDEAAIAKLLDDPVCFSLLTTFGADESPCGMLIVRSAAGEAEVLTLCVAECHRRQGLARVLLGCAVELLKVRGAKQLFLEVADGNAAALELYGSVGATPVSRRKAYYKNGADAVIFRLAL